MHACMSLFNASHGYWGGDRKSRLLSPCLLWLTYNFTRHAVNEMMVWMYDTEVTELLFCMATRCSAFAVKQCIFDFNAWHHCHDSWLDINSVRQIWSKKVKGFFFSLLKNHLLFNLTIKQLSFFFLRKLMGVLLS